MSYKIYQMKETNRDNWTYQFMGWEFAQKHSFSISDYEVTYEGDRVTYKNGDECKAPDTALEILFTIFNIHRPHDFKGHSLSVSDVVELTIDGKTDFYYCDSFGWERITESLAA